MGRIGSTITVQEISLPGLTIVLKNRNRVVYYCTTSSTPLDSDGFGYHSNDSYSLPDLTLMRLLTSALQKNERQCIHISLDNSSDKSTRARLSSSANTPIGLNIGFLNIRNYYPSNTVETRGAASYYKNIENAASQVQSDTLVG